MNLKCFLLYHAIQAHELTVTCYFKRRGCFPFYRLAKGIAGILDFAAVGIRGWFNVKRPKTGSFRSANGSDELNLHPYRFCKRISGWFWTA